jgi:hypothetical protein
MDSTTSDALGLTQLAMPIYQPRGNVTSNCKAAAIESGFGESKHEPGINGVRRLKAESRLTD